MVKKVRIIFKVLRYFINTSYGTTSGSNIHQCSQFSMQYVIG